MGLDEGQGSTAATLDEPKHPRGIQGYSLVGGGNITSWKVQGKLGGNTKYVSRLPSFLLPRTHNETFSSLPSFPDRVRGITNEGGFSAEREGWPLPGFDTSSWEKRSPSQGLATPGVGFFVTTVALDIPSGFDVPISVVYEGLNTAGSNSTAYRSQLYVNGWQFGRFVSNLGSVPFCLLSLLDS